MLDVLDLATGTNERATHIAYGLADPPTVDGGNVFVTSNFLGHAFSFDARDLSVSWKSAKTFELDPTA